jgi:hypothetical protein
MSSYPRWKSYPVNLPAPDWAEGVLESFRQARGAIDSIKNHGVSSNEALAAVWPGLEEIGFQIEQGPNRIRRPVLFKENGGVEIEYRVDLSSVACRFSVSSLVVWVEEVQGAFVK